MNSGTGRTERTKGREGGLTDERILMRRLVTVSAPLLGILLAQAGCGDSVGLDEESFDLRSVSPSADADGVSVLSSVTVRLSSEVDSASLTDGIGLESGGRSVIVDLSISDDRTVVMTPANPMDFGSEYRVLLRPTLVSRSGALLAQRAG